MCSTPSGWCTPRAAGDPGSGRAILAAAHQKAAVQLEQARAETAAPRTTANAAKLLDDHPALARFRLVQAAGPGSRMVLQLSDGPVAEALSE